MARPFKNPIDKKVKLYVYAPGGMASWLKAQTDQYGQSLSEYLLAPHMPAFLSMSEQDRETIMVAARQRHAEQTPVANPPPVEPLPAAPTVIRNNPTLAVPLVPKQCPGDSSNPCLDCANRECSPDADPCLSCHAPANPDRWWAP